MIQQPETDGSSLPKTEDVVLNEEDKFCRILSDSKLQSNKI